MNNLIKLIFGAGISQIIPILASPILTRVYLPNEFGEYAFFVSVVSLISIFMSLKFDGILISAGKDNRNSLVFFSLGFSIVLFLPIMLIDIYIALASLCNVINVIGFSYLISSSRFNFNSTFSIIRAMINTFGAVIFGFLTVSSGQIYAYVLAYSVLSVVFIMLFYRDGVFSNCDCSFPIQVLKRKSCYMLPQALLSVMYKNGPIYILTFFALNNYLGFYSLALKILLMPSLVITSALYSYFYKWYMGLSGDTETSFRRCMLKVSVSMFFIYAPIFIFGEYLFAVVFGNNWSEAGVLASYLVPWLLLSQISGTFSFMFVVHNKVKFQLKFELIYSIVSLGVLFFLLSIKIDVFYALVIYSLVSSLFILYQILYIWFSLASCRKVNYA